MSALMLNLWPQLVVCVMLVLTHVSCATSAPTRQPTPVHTQSFELYTKANASIKLGQDAQKRRDYVKALEHYREGVMLVNVLKTNHPDSKWAVVLKNKPQLAGQPIDKINKLVLPRLTKQVQIVSGALGWASFLATSYDFERYQPEDSGLIFVGKLKQGITLPHAQWKALCILTPHLCGLVHDSKLLSRVSYAMPVHLSGKGYLEQYIYHDLCEARAFDRLVTRVAFSSFISWTYLAVCARGFGEVQKARIFEQAYLLGTIDTNVENMLAFIEYAHKFKLPTYNQGVSKILRLLKGKQANLISIQRWLGVVELLLKHRQKEPALAVLIYITQRLEFVDPSTGKRPDRDEYQMQEAAEYFARLGKLRMAFALQKEIVDVEKKAKALFMIHAEMLRTGNRPERSTWRCHQDDDRDQSYQCLGLARLATDAGLYKAALYYRRRVLVYRDALSTPEEKHDFDSKHDSELLYIYVKSGGKDSKRKVLHRYKQVQSRPTTKARLEGKLALVGAVFLLNSTVQKQFLKDLARDCRVMSSYDLQRLLAQIFVGLLKAGQDKHLLAMVTQSPKRMPAMASFFNALQMEDRPLKKPLMTKLLSWMQKHPEYPLGTRQAWYTTCARFGEDCIDGILGELTRTYNVAVNRKKAEEDITELMFWAVSTLVSRGKYDVLFRWILTMPQSIVETVLSSMLSDWSYESAHQRQWPDVQSRAVTILKRYNNPGPDVLSVLASSMVQLGRCDEGLKWWLKIKRKHTLIDGIVLTNMAKKCFYLKRADVALQFAQLAPLDRRFYLLTWMGEHMDMFEMTQRPEVQAVLRSVAHDSFNTNSKNEKVE